jgi:hypothetical protein
MIVVAAALPMAPVSPSRAVNPVRDDRAEESARRVKELRKERIATLKEAADLSMKLAQGARREV